MDQWLFAGALEAKRDTYKMKLQKKIALCCFSLAVNLTAQTVKESTDQNQISVTIVSDDTGTELQEAGIKSSVTPEDLVKATRIALASKRRVHLHFGCVDERTDEEKDFTSQEILLNFEAEPPEKPDLRRIRGTMNQKSAVHKEWQRKRAAYLINLKEALDQAKTKVETFQLNAMELQQSTQSRFDRELLKRGTLDYPRSDISNMIPLAVKKLSNQGARILILNTDCIDTVEWRDSRKTPFTKAEIPADIQIFTTCETLIDNKLFANAKGQIVHVKSVQDAIEKAFVTKL